MSGRGVRPAAVIAVIAVLAGGALAYRWFAGDERLIRSQLTRLAHALSVPESEPDLARVARVADLRNYFAPDVRVSFGGQQTMSRDAILGMLARWTAPPGGIEAGFVDASITIDPAVPNRAGVYLTATLTTRGVNGEALVDASEANITMEKQEGTWVIAAVEAADTLQRP